MYTHFKPQFYYIKVGFKGGQNYIGMFSWWRNGMVDYASCNPLLFFEDTDVDLVGGHGRCKGSLYPQTISIFKAITQNKQFG